MECRIQRALADGERVVGRLLDPAGDSVAVRRPPAERFQDQQVECAAENVGRGLRHAVSHRVSMGGYYMFKRARMGMGYLPQEESIFRKMTVEQNLLAILETLPISKNERKNRCEELLSQFGIEHVAKQLAITLSGGEKRRLTIARSLVTKPSLLMLDEPFSGVDPIAVYDVQQIVSNLRQTGLGILITDHNVRETLAIVDRAYLIHEGKVLSEGTKDFLIDDPISRQFYLGERFQM